MRNKVVPFILIAATYIAITASGTGPHFVKLQVPEGWPKPTYDFTRNPLSEEGIALGRQLFYDPILSADSTKSCANCHLSYTAFTHVDHALSHGIHDSIGTRKDNEQASPAKPEFEQHGDRCDQHAIGKLPHPQQ